MPDRSETRAGVLLALAAYVVWGLSPAYWKLLDHVAATEVLAHRVLWTVPFMAAVTLRFVGVTVPRRVLGDPRALARLLLTALLISLNWGLYIWAIQVGRLVEASMGYYLSPLLAVLAGRVFFGERLRPWQVVAVALAGAGVANELIAVGVVPWLGLVLALSFVFYGVLRKGSSVDAATGLLVEGLLLAPFALGFVLWLQGEGQAAFLHIDAITTLLLVLAGIVTALPLALHVAAARRLRLRDVGLLFYIAPTLQFMLGVFVYHEPFSPAQTITFSCIWLGLAVYTLEAKWQRA